MEPGLVQDPACRRQPVAIAIRDDRYHQQSAVPPRLTVPLANRDPGRNNRGMHRDHIQPDLRDLAFDFFYWFSRFEFALKANGFLVISPTHDRATPNWDGFVSDHRSGYEPSTAAKALMEAKPQEEVVTAHGLDFADLTFSPGTADLDKVVRYAKTVRNNLFHGGKHGSAYWDDPPRMQLLLGTTIKVLADLAALAGITADYERSY